MEYLWEKEHPDDHIACVEAGAILSNEEVLILYRLAGKLSLNELMGKGFTQDEIRIIRDWYHGR